MFKKWIRNFFGVSHMVNENLILGEIPSSKEVYKKTFSIAWPSAMESILISLIGAIDMMMVGGIGPDAIAAVGITTQPKFIIMATVLALNIGTTVITSRRKGQNDKEGANRCLRNSLVLSIVLSFGLSLLGFIYAKEILTLAGADHEYITLAVQYYQIIMIGNFFTLVGLTLTSAQRGVGNTKISLKTNLTANIVNVIFNFLLINGIWIFPKLGVTGAAIATAFGNFIGFVMAVYSITRKGSFLHLHIKQDWRLDKTTVQQIVKISSASFVEQIFLRIGFFTYNALIAGLGMMAFATHQVVMNVMNISFSVGDGLSIASSSLVGQNLGAKRSDLAMIYSKVGQRVGLFVAVILGICIAIFRIPILQMFSPDPIIHQQGSPLMLVLACIVSLQILQVITIGSLRGAGDVKFVAKLSMVSVAVIRPILTYTFAYACGFGLIGAWMAVFIDQSLRNIFSQRRFNQAKWMEIHV